MNCTAPPNFRIDDFIVGANASLPVELVNFSARIVEKITEIRWSTSSETNNDYFVIERSADGHSFAEIGRVDGAGTVREPHAYTYLDRQPAPGLNYYRLRQVDVDGQFSLGPLRSVWLGVAGQARVFPSPADTYIRIQWAETGKDGATTWELFDAAGRLLMNGRAEESETVTEIPVQHLLPGAYLIRTTSVRQAWSQVFLKG